MLKRFYSLTLLLLCSMMTAWAAEVTVTPTLDVNFRTAAGNTAWQTVKNAADEGNSDFELTSTAGFFALQKYTVADLQNATKLVLTLTVGSKSGVDAVRLWSLPLTDWTAESGVDDIYPKVKEVIGVDLRATEGTPNEPLVKAAKVADSDPAKATLTITGNALAAIKANATADGTFTLLLTNDNLTNSNNKRSYLSSNTANAEANRPTLVATIEKSTPSVVNRSTGVSYSTLTDAFNAAVTDGTDAELEVYEDQKLNSRLTLSKAMTLTITPKADITIKGSPGMMWFLVNVNGGVFNIGSSDYKITLDGENKAMTIDAAVIQRENNGTMNVTNVEFKDFDLGEKARLLGDKQQGGVLTVQDITVTNCTAPATGAFIYSLRVANDALVMKGFLHIDDASTGIVIYKQANLKNDGTTEGRIKLDKTDDDVAFTASKDVTIQWVGLDGKDVMKEGAVVVIGTSGANAPLFKLAGTTDWWLSRKASNGDMYLTQTDPAPTTGITAVTGHQAAQQVYDLSGRRVSGSQPAKGLYIVNGKKVIIK